MLYAGSRAAGQPRGAAGTRLLARHDVRRPLAVEHPPLEPDLGQAHHLPPYGHHRRVGAEQAGTDAHAGDQIPKAKDQF